MLSIMASHPGGIKYKGLFDALLLTHHPFKIPDSASMGHTQHCKTHLLDHPSASASSSIYCRLFSKIL
jgi:hypothetical protein